ncbi:MAG: protein-methionine-sulfoxide reductase heme-binding subunit MsrQ [Gemmatimonadales bacterium]|jgi:sulfoxide reductase heme-binding subunit YedZ
MTQTEAVRRVLKPLVFAVASAPAGLLLIDGLTGAFGPNPVEEMTHRTGIAAIVLLVVTLAITPLRKALRLGALVQFRRMLGLFAFFYATLHVLTYAIDQTYLSGLGVSPSAIVDDVLDRPYITMGLAAFLLLVPLAVTSTKGWVRRLGGRRWQRLHRLVYVAAVAASVHFLWLVKADMTRPLIIAGLVGGLLAYRLASRVAGKRQRLPLQSVGGSSSGAITPM